MTSHDTVQLVNRTDSYNSESGSFWNMSSSEAEAESVIEEVLPLGGTPLRQQRKLPPKPEPEVQSLEVRHVIGISKDSSSPLGFASGDVVAFLAGPFVTLYNLRTHCQVQHLSIESRRRSFACLAISEDATLIAAGEQGQDPSVVVWIMEHNVALHPFELKAHKDTISAIAFSPNGKIKQPFPGMKWRPGKYLASVGDVQDSQLVLWDCQSETALCSQLIHIQANLTSLSFSMDSRVLYASGSQFTMWSLVEKAGRFGASSSAVSLSAKPALPSSEKAAEVVDVKMGGNAKASYMYALTKNGVLYKLSSQKGGMTMEKKTDLRVSRAFSLAVGGNKIAVATSNGVVKIVKTKNLSVEATITKPHSDHSISSSPESSSDALYTAFDHESTSLAVVYSDNTIAFWDVSNTSDIHVVDTLESHSGCITDIAPIASATSDLKSLDRNVVKAMRSPNIHNPQAVESEFATCSDKGNITLWSLKIQMPRSQQVLISPPTERPRKTTLKPRQRQMCGLGLLSNAQVQIEKKTISVDYRPQVKSKPAAKKPKNILSSGIRPAKDSKRAMGGSKASISTAKPKKSTTKRVVASSSTIPKRLPTRKPSTIKSSTKGKGLMGTPGPMRLSTELASSAVMKPPVIAVHKPSHSKTNSLEAEAFRIAPVEDTPLTCIRVSPNGFHLVVGDEKGQLRIYHLESMKLLSKKALHESAITTIEFSLPGKDGECLMATGAKDGTVSVMEVNKDFKLKLEKEDHSEPVTGLAFTPEGKAVVSCGRDNYLYYENLAQQDYVDEEDIELFLSRHFLMTSTFEAMHFNAARNTYMLACSDNFIRVFNAMGQFVHALRIPEELGAPTKILQGPIPSMIITCHDNNKVGIFEYFTGKLLAVGVSHSNITGALLINNGRNLVTTGNDGVMVIWDLHEELCRRCIALPVEFGVPQTETGYATELFFRMQREKERASLNETSHCITDQRSSEDLMDRMVSIDSLTSGASTSMFSRPGSRLSGNGIPIVSPVARSRAIPRASRDAMHLPSWMSKADGLSDDGFLDGFESTSPLYRPPKLDLDNLSETDDESINLFMKLKRGHSLVPSRFSDLDSLPVDDFMPGYSRRGASFENSRFNRPVDSMRWGGRRSKDSMESSPIYNLDPSCSLAQYQDDHTRPVYHHNPAESFDLSMAFARPTGPEPPSSVSCASDSRNSTPFCLHPPSCFETEALLRNMCESVDGRDEQFVLLRSPHSSTGPIGPHIHRIASRTPASMYSDDKTVYTRPNSEEHTTKMFSDMRPNSDESVSPSYTPFAMDGNLTYWRPYFAGEDIEEHLTESESDEIAGFRCPTDRCDTPIAKVGGRMNKNPLYSSGSELSDRPCYKTRPLDANLAPLAHEYSLEEEVSFSDMACIEKGNQSETPKFDGALRKSMDLFWETVKSSVTESLLKLKEDIGIHQSLADMKLPTSRKQAYVDKTCSKLSAFLDALQGQTLHT